MFLPNIYRTYIRDVTRWYSRFKIDPGINLRKKILSSSEELEENDFDDLETDFMNVHKTHKEHVSEIEAKLEKEKFYIVKQKYFKQSCLNFLTWHDKEQIRYLHNTDPEEWTIDKLSEGFPALPEDIKKILKSKWTITPARMISHDKVVQTNWENFKNGKFLDLPKDQADHLNKFTNRALILKPFETPQTKRVVTVNLKPIGTEFSEIITSYNILKSKKCGDSKEDILVNFNKELLNDNDSNIGDNKAMSKQPLTLQQLQNNIEKKLRKNKEIAEEEKLLVKTLKQPSPQQINLIELNENSLEVITKNKYEISKTSVKKNDQDFNHLIYPEKISIPKDKRKKGFTYKLNDCFYDDDGLFLYRVPGMY